MAASRRVVGLKLFGDLMQLQNARTHDITLELKVWFAKLRRNGQIGHYLDGIT